MLFGEKRFGELLPIGVCDEVHNWYDSLPRNEQRSERLHDGCRNASLTFWLTYAGISGFGVGKVGRSVGRVPDVLVLVLRTDSCLKAGGRSSPEAAGKT